MILSVGEKDWPFPIPLVKSGKRWVFDTRAGKEEILNRRVGENELDTVQTLLAIVDAQREYAMKPRDNDGIRQYAEKFQSDPGKQNGLYWERPRSARSPARWASSWPTRGPRVTGRGQSRQPVPYHGYFFRMLKKQGKHAPGGAYRLRGQEQDDRRLCRRRLPGGLRESPVS